MKNIFAITAILLIITATANKAIALTEPDSIHSYQYINRIRMSEPEKAITLCDEAIEMGMKEPYMYWYIKGITYMNIRQQENAYACTTKALEYDECKQDKETYINCLSNLREYYRFVGKLEDAIRISTEGLEFARIEKNVVWEGLFLRGMAICLYEIDKVEEGNEHLRMAEKILDCDIAQNNSISSMKELLETLTFLTATSIDQLNYKEALRAGLKYEQTVMNIMANNCELVDFDDLYFARLFPLIATAYEHLDNHEEAEKYFKKWESLKNTNNPNCYSLAIVYLYHSKQYEKALEYNKKFWDFQKNEDTISTSYSNVLLQRSEILDQIGDYENAFKALKRNLIIQDSIYKREKHQISIEMATAYQVKEKEAATALAKQKIKWMSAVIVLLIVIIVSTIAYSAITIRRTKALAKSIKERIDNEDLHNSDNDFCNTPPAEDASSEPDQNSINRNDNFKALFKKMDELVKSEKLYLNPNLQRDDLAKMVNISKNDFANFIQQNAGCNTNTYINNLRLEYAVRTLVHEPEYKISAVAELSGIPNLSTFYRLFTERYGITPVKFAKNIASN